MKKSEQYENIVRIGTHNINDALDVLDDILDSAWNVPLSSGRCMVDASSIRDCVDDIRLAIPEEIKQAKKILLDKQNIIAEAKTEADRIIIRAEQRANSMVENEVILRQAKRKSEELLAETKNKTREMTNTAADYVDGLLSKSEEILTQNLQAVQKTRQSFKQHKKRA